MQECKIILTWEAIYDLTDIADYIERDFGKSRADRFEKDIRQQIRDIGYMGGIYGNTHIYYRSYSIFKKTFPPSIIFYVIKEPENEIHIMSLLFVTQNTTKKEMILLLLLPYICAIAECSEEFVKAVSKRFR